MLKVHALVPPQQHGSSSTARDAGAQRRPCTALQGGWDDLRLKEFHNRKTKQAQEDPPPFTHSAIPPLPAVAAAEGNDALQQMHAS
eukprot:scaffold57345_cov20-Tisochrysis_lutea.AAC.4